MQQVSRLGRLLESASIDAIYTSPLERAVETAEAIAAPHRLAPIVIEDLGELHFGSWEGRTFSELEPDHDWVRFNIARSTVRPPGGELMVEAQTRMVRTMEHLASKHNSHTVAVVSHADPLRSLIAYYLGMPIDFLSRFNLSPASITIVEFSGDHPCVLAMNCTSDPSLELQN